MATENVIHFPVPKKSAEELAQGLWFPPYAEPDQMTLDAYARANIADGSEKRREAHRAIVEQGRQAFIDGHASSFLFSASSANRMRMVEWNAVLLKERGIYEEALLCAITNTRTNNHSTPLRVFRDLFDWADRAKLLSAGDPLPSPGPFTLYRGVAGKAERDRRVRGISWTGTLAKAAWFANRPGFGLPNPEVYRCVVDAKHVLAYVGSHRNEDEYVVDLPRSVKVERVALPLPEPKEAA